MLHGRELEGRRLAALLDDARAGRGGALVVLGEPGAGKSALLEQLAASPHGCRVLRTQGLESEAPLAFAALQRLLQPVRGLVPHLPPAQRRAVEDVLGVGDGAAVEPFLVALATLSLLSEAAETASTSVLCVVDDAHWLDTASRDALLLVARRLSDEPVALVFASRPAEGPGFEPVGVDTLVLRGLDPAAAGALLAERRAAPLPAPVVAALVARTGGNPLALVELPATLSERQLAGAEPLPDRLSLGRAVERSFLDRVRRLSEQGQSALLVASADDSGQLRVVRDAAARLGADAGALAEVERAGLVVTAAEAVRVVHPLVRSATYSAATGDRRRAAHRALAAALATSGDTDDADRRAWHLAACADGPDRAVAAALATVGARAERRGGYAEAAAAFTRGAALAEDDATRARLLFDAARDLWLDGQAEPAGAALARARPLAGTVLLRADVDRLRARLEVNVGSAAVAHRLLTDAGRAIAADDPERALEMAVAARLLCVYDPAAAHGVAEVPVPTAPAAGSGARVETLHRVLAALRADAAGRTAEALASLEAAHRCSLDLREQERPDDVTAWTTCAASEPDVVANVGNTATHLGHDRVAVDCYTRVLADGRRTGAATVVLYALPRLAATQLLQGRWDEVRHGAHEAVELAASIGQPALSACPLAWLALVAALQADPAYEEHRQRAAAAGQERLGVLTQLCGDLRHWAAATAAGRDGDHGGALHHYAAMRVPSLRRMTVVDRVVSAVRAGQHALARDELDAFTRYAGAGRQPWALAAAEHGRAVLAAPDEAARHLERALDHHRHSGRVVDRAHAQLAYGELLRRGQRRADARPHLRAALAVLDDVGSALAARAREELRASGETARRRDPSTLVALTPMEAQVARLVAQGLSNKDAAAQLWISPRTVAFHLRGVFAKLGVSSRGALAQVPLP